MIVTGSWDKTVRYWDLRQSKQVGQVECQERVYGMDLRKDLLVVATAGRYVHTINLNQPFTFSRTDQTTLKHQIRSVACFEDAKGYALGGIEGRCSIVNLEHSGYVFFLVFRCLTSRSASRSLGAVV